MSKSSRPKPGAFLLTTSDYSMELPGLWEWLQKTMQPQCYGSGEAGGCSAVTGVEVVF
jgi:hypothetical protein